MTVAKHLSRALWACLAGTLAFAGVSQTHAQTISNVATAQWAVEGETVSIQSNVVRFNLAPNPVKLTTLTPMPGASQQVLLQPSYCSGPVPPGGLPTRPPSPGATPLVTTSQLRVGQELVVQVTAPNANTDSAIVETIRLVIETPQGDKEELLAIESAPDSGIFFAAIATKGIPPTPVPRDCTLSLTADSVIKINAYARGSARPLVFGTITALADPYGIVFDSLDGKPVDGARVTLVDAATGAPANVYAYDGITPYPSTVITGQTVTDAGGTAYPLAPGNYLFPLAPLGNYRFVVVPPAPYTAPSAASPADLALLRQPDGTPFVISAGSYGGVFALTDLIPLETDIPVDAPGGAITIDKRASLARAQPGDVVFYQVTVRNTESSRPSRSVTLIDSASSSLRLRPDTIRVDGQDPGTSVTPAPDGHGFTLDMPGLVSGQQVRISYAMSVRPDAAPGQAINRMTGQTSDGLVTRTQAVVRIDRDNIAGRMTLIGRIVEGGCGDPAQARGIAGVRVMLEDGSFALTDADGRYHFEGLVPGTHVVQAASETLPKDARFVDCARSTRSAGATNSRFVWGQGGSLLRADFHAIVPEGTVLAEAEPARIVKSDQSASGADADWFALGDGPAAFLFPAIDQNPRSPSIRVALRHASKQTVELQVNGVVADALSFDGAKLSPNKRWRVSLWRGIRLQGHSTRLTAIVRNADGSEAQRLEREVHYSDTPMRAQFVKEESHLIADGVTRPVLAVRVLDRYGRPVHSGISGTFTIDGAYQSASAIEARKNQALTGFGNSSASWVVEGDDGLAYLELAPTMLSGALRLRFQFNDGETSREEVLESWIEPGEQPWTLIGLAEGSIGARSVADNMERSGDFDSDLGEDARVAFYAKGRVLGRYLLTMAYDSAKQKDDQRLLGTIDPAAYYTVFGDASERLFDAASREKLYLRVENATFYALYGDFETGFDQTDLARYQRIATGVKGEAKFGQVQAQGFVAKIGSRHRRDEIQGGGITGPYRLSSRSIIANSERVTLETRDRLRPEVIVERRDLIRFLDYDIDLLSGTITFARPLLSRDIFLNPQFVVIDYETDDLGESEWNGGLRTTWTSKGGSLRIGASAITDKGDEDRSDLGALDLRLKVGANTEIRAEAAVSRQSGESSEAYSLEVEHHTGQLDIAAYAKQIDEDFGVGQQNVAERGRRKIGGDARYALTKHASIIASGWADQSLSDESERQAIELRAAWRNDKTDAFVGIAHLADHLADGRDTQSTVLQGGVTQRLLDNKLEISGASSIALSTAEATDLPARHQLGLRYSVTQNVKAVATYEIAAGDAIDARTLRGGVEITPWVGSQITTTLGKQQLGPDAQRTFAALSLSQSLRLSEALTLDASLDGNRTIGGGIKLDDVYNPAHPVSSGGHLGQDGELSEDFTALSAGLAWNRELWNARIRGEYRDGEYANRAGFSLAAIRQLGEGRVLGGGLTWTRATGENDTSTEVMDAALSMAHRPAGSDFAFLTKLEYRSDMVTGAVAGETGPAGRTALLVDGDAKSRRLIFSVASNWSPQEEREPRRTEVGLFAGVRHNLDRLEGQDLSGTTLLGGLDLSFGLGEKFEIGGRATIRSNIDEGTTSFAVGPEIGFSPTDGMVLSLGYNLVGFRDPDFSAARNTDQGVFASLRMKLDRDSFGFLGLGR